MARLVAQWRDLKSAYQIVGKEEMYILFSMILVEINQCESPSGIRSGCGGGSSHLALPIGNRLPSRRTVCDSKIGKLPRLESLFGAGANRLPPARL